ncbi:MAG: hypothetical protein C4522_12620 [Desulfobacteraceae bacterium]|nr:MAG: hypothetical protein C4522_12620 [Desulfobacteraceae bacterium]
MPIKKLNGDNRRRNKWEQRIKKAKKGIVRIVCRLHIITLNSSQNMKDRNNLSIPESENIEALGDLWFDSKYDPQIRNPNYSSRGIKQYSKFRLDIFFNPQKPYLPIFKIEIHPKADVSLEEYIFFLTFLANRIPSLKVSKIEYAIDVFCKGPFYVSELFKLILKTIYVPYQRKYNEFGGNLNKGEPQSSVFRIGDQYKVYERGDDDKKDGKGWNKKDFNRVRIENSVKRRTLKKSGIDTLTDFMKNPKFIELNLRKWSFKDFKPSNILPGSWGLNFIFQKELIDARKKTRGERKNFAQYIVDVQYMNFLSDQVNKAMRDFTKMWKAI